MLKIIRFSLVYIRVSSKLIPICLIKTLSQKAELKCVSEAWKMVKFGKNVIPQQVGPSERAHHMAS